MTWFGRFGSILIKFFFVNFNLNVKNTFKNKKSKEFKL